MPNQKRVYSSILLPISWTMWYCQSTCHEIRDKDRKMPFPYFQKENIGPLSFLGWRGIVQQRVWSGEIGHKNIFLEPNLIKNLVFNSISLQKKTVFQLWLFWTLVDTCWLIEPAFKSVLIWISFVFKNWISFT